MGKIITPQERKSTINSRNQAIILLEMNIHHASMITNNLTQVRLNIDQDIACKSGVFSHVTEPKDEA